MSVADFIRAVQLLTFPCGCGIEVRFIRDEVARTWRIQHGKNPEHSRVFSDEQWRENGNAAQEWLDALHSRDPQRYFSQEVQ